MIFTSEQVSMGHPDKICDQISDAIVTDCLRNDPNSRVAVEALIKGKHVTVAGEITSRHTPDIEQLVHDVLLWAEPSISEDFELSVFLTKQSQDIAQGVDKKGAGDQGMMFGYATNETPEMLPIPFVLATKAIELLQNTDSPLLLPDAKAQVSYDYKKNRIDTFLISTQHTADADLKAVREICEDIMRRTALLYGLNTDFTVQVNPTGRFVTGGSFGDTGVTGRKIIADTYGGMCRHGGGAFSGKDPTKVDRSAAYMARKIAKDIVRSGLAQKCEVQLAYAIGIAEPVSVSVDCFHTSGMTNEEVASWIRKHYDLTPEGIIRFLHLRNVDYTAVSTLGHFWRQNLPWEE